MNKAENKFLFTFEQLVASVRQVHETLISHASKAVNISLTIRNWLIGCYIAEYELHGTDRAKYGDALLSNLASKLTTFGVSACARRQLYQYLRFYRTYPGIVRSATAQFQQLVPESLATDQEKARSTTALSGLDTVKIEQRLSYTHIEQLTAIDDKIKRAFYEVECIRGNWSVHELRRQIASLYYERSGLSKNKKKLAEMARAGAVKSGAKLAIRDPYIFEFLGIKPKEVMGESDLEDALLDKLQDFLLELGHGFCFEARQKRILIGDTYGFVDHLFVSKYQLELPRKEDIERFIERKIAETVVRDENSGTGRIVREFRAKYERDDAEWHDVYKEKVLLDEQYL